MTAAAWEPNEIDQARSLDVLEQLRRMAARFGYDDDVAHWDRVLDWKAAQR